MHKGIIFCTIPDVSGIVSVDSFIRLSGRGVLVLILLATCATLPLGAQAPAEPPPGQVAPGALEPTAGEAALAAQIDGPPPPVAPAVMNRDEGDRTTVRAIRLATGIRLDGVLDEEVYTEIAPITDFVQQLPTSGAPATERTDAWIMYDDENIYVSARVHDSAPESEWVANEMRRDTNQLRQNDTFAVLFDTFYDRRNGLNFYTNPLGARADIQITNEGDFNSDWNPVWDVRTGRWDGGWTAEMEIPFKTLRYRGGGGAQLWGVQLRRSIRRKNEWTYLTRIPMSAGGGRGTAGIVRVSAAATLVGLEPPEASRLVEIKPYVIGGVATDRNSIPVRENDGSGEFGADVKLGITYNLTADLTYNTDFAQVEVDEQQVNLTRFSLFFPEKREFFLEGRGIFDFARGGLGARAPTDISESPTLFYSRRIGLEGDAETGAVVVPIHGGARMTGKAGAFDIGLLSIQTEESPEAGTASTNFTVLRLRRDVLRRSSIGAIFTNRSVSLVGPGASQAYGVDGTFSFYENVDFVTYYSRTQTPLGEGRDASYQGRFDYGGDRYGATVDHITVEENFLPEIGFMTRDNYRRSTVSGRFSPRPQGSRIVRRYSFEAGVDYFTTADRGFLETRERTVDFSTEFHNSDRLEVNLTNSYELLLEPFSISRNVVLPVGGYDFTAAMIAYELGAQHRASGRLSFTAGSFWSGNIRTLEYFQGRLNVTRQFSVEPTISFNDIDLPEGEFTTTLVSTRFNYAFNPWMFFGGLVQYNSGADRVSYNLRLRWEYSPGSELFVVYTEEQDVNSLRPMRMDDRLRNRGFVVKLNRLFRL